jgi:hypothetical protein
MRLKTPKDGATRYKWAFCWLPRRFDGAWYWLEWVYLRQRYTYDVFPFFGMWLTMCVSDPKTGFPLKDWEIAKINSKLKQISFDDGREDNTIHNYLRSEQFKLDFRKTVEADTWDKGLPMYYMDDEGWLVEHWKDGIINRIKKLK